MDDHRVAPARGGHAAQLDRPLGGRRGQVPLRRLDTDYEVFTTRPDTLFGATFFVMAPEHPDVLRLSDSPEVAEYVRRTLTESAEERGAEDRRRPASRWAPP